MFIENKNIACIFKDYNDKLSEAYNGVLLSSFRTQAASNDSEIVLNNSVKKSMIEWTQLYKCKQFGGISFNAYFKLLDDEVMAFEYILHAAYICDDGIPPILLSLLDKNKDNIISIILDYILKVDWENDFGGDVVAGDDIIAVSSLISIFEFWECNNHFDSIANKYVSTGKPFDIISDAVKFYLSSLSINDDLVQYLTKNINSILEQNHDLSIQGEVLLISLVAISAGINNDSTYMCLENCFLRTNKKIISAICFGDLKDERAIEFLRNWIFENQKKKIDELLQNEIISSIKRLGGKTSDIECIIT